MPLYRVISFKVFVFNNFHLFSLFTYLILKLTSFVVPLRVDEQEEIEGLDLRSHGEKGYHSD